MRLKQALLPVPRGRGLSILPMLTGLVLTAFLMGLGGIPHCTAMCGAACAVAFPRGLPWATWLGRLGGYMALGCVAAVSAGVVSRWGREVAMLRPLWLMAQVAVVMLGLHLLVRGRMPEVLSGAGRSAYEGWRRRVTARSRTSTPRREAAWRALWPLIGGVSWALLPCGLLYAALMVAALAPDAWGGGLVMLAFGVPSSAGVWAAPWVMRRLAGWRREPVQVSGRRETAPAAAPAARAAVPVIWMRPSDARLETTRPAALETAAPRADEALVDPRWAVRASGLSLAAMGAWSVWHQLMAQWQAWCA